MKRAIITGATGMLGIALVKKLINENIHVTAIVRPGSSRVKRLPVHKNICIVECELSQLLLLKERLLERYDYFFHFAWEGTYGNARNDMPLQNANIKGTLAAVDLARHLGCTVFLGAGSQAEYGSVSGKLTPDTPTNPQTGYGMAKLCAGQMSRIMCQSYGIRHIWMRILSTYGPYDGMHTMVVSGILQMLQNQRPQYTKGEQMWDYLYCDDAANAFYLAALRGPDSAVYCLGSGNVRPLADYIRDIRDVVSPGCDIGFGEIPYYPNQVMYLCADISSLTKDTGFMPEKNFKDGIFETEKWLREVISNEKD